MAEQSEQQQNAVLGTFIGSAIMPKYYIPPELTPEELEVIHSLPDQVLLTAIEAAAFLRLKYHTLAWYRSQGGGPAWVRVGNSVRYRVGDIKSYVKAGVVSHD